MSVIKYERETEEIFLVWFRTRYHYTVKKRKTFEEKNLNKFICSEMNKCQRKRKIFGFKGILNFR